jgi:hypothetical protein
MTLLAAPSSSSHVGRQAARRTLADYYWLLLATVLMGYALMGKGFAYVGLPPVYIGDTSMVIGIVVLLRMRGWSPVLKLPQTLAMIPFAAWGAWRMVPYLSEYGIDAVRDAVIWGYGAFAIVVAGMLIAEPRRLVMLLNWYRRFGRIFLLGVPVVWIAYRGFNSSLPRWPWVNVPVIFVKEGDIMVHLAGILAFWMADVRGATGILWVALLTACVAAVGVVDRAGTLAFAAALGLCLIARPHHKVIWRSAAMLIGCVFVLWATDIHLEIPGGKGREISFRQVVINAETFLGADSGDHGLDSNKDWRLNWWSTIVDYTIHGRYFWQGKGFGINLADDDGFQLFADGSLRSPHSIHMTVLARTGVPGLVLWAAYNLTWAGIMIAAYFHSRRYEEVKWQGVFLFLFAYWMAFLINGSFDVFLEGPMGGVWYWCLSGVGAAAVWLYHHHPDLLDDQGDDAGADRAQLLPAAGWRRPGLPLGTGAAGIVRA